MKESEMANIANVASSHRSSNKFPNRFRTLLFPLLLIGVCGTVATGVEVETILSEWERQSKEVITARLHIFYFTNSHLKEPASESQVVQSLRRLEESVPTMSYEAAQEALCESVEGLIGGPMLRDRTVELVQRGDDVLNRWLLREKLQRAHAVHDDQNTVYAAGLTSVVINKSPKTWMFRFSLIRPELHRFLGWELDPAHDGAGRIALRTALATGNPSNTTRVEVDRDALLLRWLETPGYQYRLRTKFQDFDGVTLPTIGVDVKVAQGVVRDVRAFQIIEGELNVPISSEDLFVTVEAGTQGVDFRSEPPLGFPVEEAGAAIIMADQRQEMRLRARQERAATNTRSGTYRYALVTLLIVAVTVSFVLAKRLWFRISS